MRLKQSVIFFLGSIVDPLCDVFCRVVRVRLTVIREFVLIIRSQRHIDDYTVRIRHGQGTFRRV